MSNPQDLSKLSLEQLLSLDLTVTSVSKREEDLADTAAAIYALTPEELRRSGATSIAEALRGVPGIEVARFNANTWNISGRGFNGQFNNKMLVLQDGRALYSSLFGGVWWSDQDTLLEDLDRIEVIRGPGGTLWGANAVNGVINVESKPAEATQGSLAWAGGGNIETSSVGARWGGATGANTHYRVFVKGFSVAPFAVDPVLALPAHDGWNSVRGGFRLDTRIASGTFTAEGDAYVNHEDQTWVRLVVNSAGFPQQTTPGLTDPVNGADLVAHYRLPTGAASSLAALAYFDHNERFDQRGELLADLARLEAQENLTLGGSDELVVGAGATLDRSNFGASEVTSLTPAARDRFLPDAFVQDELRLLGDRLKVIAGTKVEQNDFTGLEIQPTVRVSVKPATRQTVWAAFSRAVRTPDRIEHDGAAIETILPGPFYVEVDGNSKVKSEVLDAFEAGWRTQLGDRLSIDLAAYDNRYESILSVNPANQTGPVTKNGRQYFQIPFTNEPGGTVAGGEAEVKASLLPNWTLGAGYSYTRTWLSTIDNEIARPAPINQASLKSYLDLPSLPGEINAAWYYCDAAGSPPDDVAPFNRVDLGFTWRASKRIELAVWGQNLLQESHVEYRSTFEFGSDAVPRSFWGRLTTRF